MLGAVVDRMEAPEQRDLMAPAVAPVEADLAHHHCRDHARPERQAAAAPVTLAGRVRMDDERDQRRGRPEQEDGTRLLMKYQPRFVAQSLWNRLAGRTAKKCSSGAKIATISTEPHAGPQRLQQKACDMLMRSQKRLHWQVLARTGGRFTPCRHSKATLDVQPGPVLLGLALSLEGGVLSLPAAIGCEPKPGEAEAHQRPGHRLRNARAGPASAAPR